MIFSVILFSLLFCLIFLPNFSIPTVYAYIEANPIPTTPYPYFSDGVHQWVFENNAEDSGSSVVDYDLSGSAIYNNSISLIRSGEYCAWFNGSNYLEHSIAFDSWRTNYSEGWGLSIWFYVTSSQTWKVLFQKFNDDTPDNQIEIQPNRALLEVDDVLNYKDFSPSYQQNIWNNIIITQASNGSAWVWLNGNLQAFWTNYPNILGDDDGGYDFTVGARNTGSGHSNHFTGAIDDIRFYDFTLNQTYVDFLWTAVNPPESGDWLIDADTELYNEENITITDGSIIIGEETPDREVNFTAYNTNFYFDSNENDLGIYGDGVRMNFVNLTQVQIFNATDKWIRVDFYMFSELHLNDVYYQHGGNNYSGSIPMLRVNPYYTRNVPIRINNLTLYDANGTALGFQGCNAEDDIIVNGVNVTEFTINGIGLGNSLDSAPKGGTWNDIYIYTSSVSTQSIITYSQNDVWTNLELVGSGVMLSPHKLFQWQGNNNMIRDSVFRDCDNGIWLSASDGNVLYVYNATIDNCADGVDSGSGTLFLYDSIISNTRDRAFSLEGTEVVYVIDSQIIDTGEGQHDIYYRAGNITFINTAFNGEYSSPSGDYDRNIFQHWNFSSTDVYVNCTTVDDESNLYVAIQSASYILNELTYDVYIPVDSINTVVYTGSLGKPDSVYLNNAKISTWSYDSDSSLLTIYVDNSFALIYEIKVVWSEITFQGVMVGGVFLIILGILPFILILGVILKKR